MIVRDRRTDEVEHLGAVANADRDPAVGQDAGAGHERRGLVHHRHRRKQRLDTGLQRRTIGWRGRERHPCRAVGAEGIAERPPGAPMRLVCRGGAIGTPYG